MSLTLTWGTYWLLGTSLVVAQTLGFTDVQCLTLV